MQRLGRQLTGQKDNPDPESTADHYEKQTKALEAQDNFLQTKERINNPPSMKEMQQKQLQDAEEARKAAEERERKLRDDEKARIQQEKEEAAAAAAEEKSKREEAEQKLRDQNTQMLLDKLNELKGQQKPWNEQLSEFLNYGEELATKLGFQKSTIQTRSEDPHIALELAKLDLERDRESRKFQLELEESKRKWDLQMLEFKQAREFKIKELELQEKRDGQIFTLPEVIGGAIAKGLLDQGGNVAGGPVRNVPGPEFAPEPIEYHVEIPEGLADQFQCPNCKGPVAVGPTSTIATCVGCNSQFPIKRIPAVAQQPTEE